MDTSRAHLYDSLRRINLTLLGLSNAAIKSTSHAFEAFIKTKLYNIAANVQCRFHLSLCYLSELPNDAQQSRATFRFWDILRRELLLKTVTVSEGCLTHIVLLTGLYDFTGDRNSAEHCIQWLSPTAAAHYGKDFLTTSKNDESEKLHWVPLTITSLPLPSPPPPTHFALPQVPVPEKFREESNLSFAVARSLPKSVVVDVCISVFVPTILAEVLQAWRHPTEVGRVFTRAFRAVTFIANLSVHQKRSHFDLKERTSKNENRPRIKSSSVSSPGHLYPYLFRHPGEVKHKNSWD